MKIVGCQQLYFEKTPYTYSLHSDFCFSSSDTSNVVLPAGSAFSLCYNLVPCVTFLEIVCNLVPFTTLETVSHMDS